MPILKTEILGSLIEINYEESEKDKLRKVIEKFNERLLDFENVIITNLNEGILPSGKIHSNLFPFEVTMLSNKVNIKLQSHKNQLIINWFYCLFSFIIIFLHLSLNSLLFLLHYQRSQQ